MRSSFPTSLRSILITPRFHAEGTSKAKRLRYFLRTSDLPTRVRALKALWEYRCAPQRRKPIEEQIPDAQSEFDRLIARISGSLGTSAQVTDTNKPGVKAVDPAVLTDPKSKLIEITCLRPNGQTFGLEQPTCDHSMPTLRIKQHGRVVSL